MPCALSIPAADLDAFGLLPTREKENVMAWLDCIAQFEKAPCKARALQALAVKYHGRIKVTKSTLYRKRDLVSVHGWEGLVNRARTLGDSNRNLPEEFIQFWQGLCLDNQRKTAPAYRALFLDHLHKGLMIPGYGGAWQYIYACEHTGRRIPEHCPFEPDRFTPAGWGYRNLCRYAPDKFSLTAARLGLGAATSYLPRIPTTRAGLRPGQFYVVDDMEHDVKVNFAGNIRSYTPLELDALDLFTGHLVSWGLKPVRELDNSEREHIRKHYMRALMVHLLCVVGFDPDGCTILGEHGTATLDAATLARINTYAGGAIKFDAGGLNGAPLIKGLYDGRPRGNSRWKAALESHHNLKHNELASLPGQKGKDWASAPESDYGREKENNALLKVCHALAESRPDLVNQLALPYMQFHQFRELVTLAYDRIARRLDHSLEGYEQAGLTVQEYRLDKALPWQPMAGLLELPPPARAAVTAVIESNPSALVNCRPMSPLEAWQKTASNLRTISIAAGPDILGPEFGIKCRVNDRAEIEVSDPDYKATKHVFSAMVNQLDGFQNHLARGREIVVHLLSPIDASFAFVSTPDGAFIGAAPALVRACRTDTETLHQNLGIRSAVLAEEKRKLIPHANKLLREREEASKRNAELLTGRDPAAEKQQRDHAAEEAVQATRGRPVDGVFSDLLVAAESVISTPGEEDENYLSAIF